MHDWKKKKKNPITNNNIKVKETQEHPSHTKSTLQ
jgi:hypothetical protein